jgi:hypothetical protein
VSKQQKDTAQVSLEDTHKQLDMVGGKYWCWDCPGPLAKQIQMVKWRNCGSQMLTAWQARGWGWGVWLDPTPLSWLSRSEMRTYESSYLASSSNVADQVATLWEALRAKTFSGPYLRTATRTHYWIH